MKIQTYQGENIRAILDKAPYDWRATGTYGVERSLKNGKISNILLIYVNSRDLKEWDKYLTANSVKSTKVLPDLKLVGVDTLPESSKKDRNVVDISHLIADLEKVAPRYRETHPEIVEHLSDVA
ncbi:hypothetical protein KY346_06475 [Candidatus Woesearchaeota archaeon]|nr:hypothetical protein [Candidatus Woesearchaeota archaeon]